MLQTKQPFNAMFKRWLLVLLARVSLIALGLCCCLFLVYLLACKPTSTGGHPVALWPGGTSSKEGYMALLQEREDSHRHYINSLTKQIAQLKEALLERTQQLQDSLEKAKTKGILPGGLESLHKMPTQSDLKVGKHDADGREAALRCSNNGNHVSPGVPPLPA